MTEQPLPIDEKPFRVTTWALDGKGNEHVEVLTYWCATVDQVRRHLASRRTWHAQTGWTMHVGAIGLSWSYRRQQALVESFRGVARTLSQNVEEQERRRWSR